MTNLPIPGESQQDTDGVAWLRRPWDFHVPLLAAIVEEGLNKCEELQAQCTANRTRIFTKTSARSMALTSTFHDVTGSAVRDQKAQGPANLARKWTGSSCHDISLMEIARRVRLCRLSSEPQSAANVSRRSCTLQFVSAAAVDGPGGGGMRAHLCDQQNLTNVV